MIVTWETTYFLNSGVKKIETTTNGPLYTVNSESQAIPKVQEREARGERLRYLHSPSSSSFKEIIFEGDYSTLLETLTETAAEGKPSVLVGTGTR